MRLSVSAWSPHALKISLIWESTCDVVPDLFTGVVFVCAPKTLCARPARRLLFEEVLASPRGHYLLQLGDYSRALDLLEAHETARRRRYARVVFSRLELAWLAPHPVPRDHGLEPWTSLHPCLSLLLDATRAVDEPPALPVATRVFEPSRGQSGVSRHLRSEATSCTSEAT